MVDKDTYFEAGVNTSFSSELNSCILQPISLMTSVDNVVQSANTSAAETAGSTAYATKRTIDIDAAAIQDHVIIRGDLGVSRTAANSDADTIGYMQLTIDGAQALETSISIGKGAAYGAQPIRGWIYKYTPSSGEKAAGFTIDLDLRVDKSATAGYSTTGYVYNYYWDIEGA